MRNQFNVRTSRLINCICIKYVRTCDHTQTTLNNLKNRFLHVTVG